VFERAVSVVGEHPDQGLGFTDATTVALAEERGLDVV
jgi:predicted nucleic acid-binding protein